MTGLAQSLLYTGSRGKPRSGAQYSSDWACPCHATLPCISTIALFRQALLQWFESAQAEDVDRVWDEAL